MIPPPEDLSPVPADPPSLIGRAGERIANAPSDILNDLMRLTYNVTGGSIATDEGKPFEVDKPYEIPEAKTGGEMVVDLGANLAESLPFFLSGEGAGEGAAKLLESGPVLSRMLRVGGGFAAQGATESPTQAVGGAAVGAGMGAAEALPGPLRFAAAAGSGVLSGLLAKDAGASDTQSTIVGATNAILPLILHKRLVPEPRSDLRPSPLSLPEAPDRPLLGDVQTAQPIPGTGGPIPYGGELPESTSRARPIFGTERVSQPIEAEFRDELNGAAAPAPIPPAILGLPARTEPPTGAPVREPTFTEGEIARARQPVATLQSAAPSPVEDVRVAPETASPTQPAKRVLLRSVLSPENKGVAKAAADKLGLEYKGLITYGNKGFFEFKVPEDASSKEAGANISLPIGSTYRDLKNHLNFKREQFEANNPDELTAVNQKYAEHQQRLRDLFEPAAPTEKAETKVATLQPEKAAPAPTAPTTAISPTFSLENAPPPPAGLNYGDKVMFRRPGEAEPLSGIIQPGVEPNTYRLVEKDGTAHDVPPRDIIAQPARVGRYTLRSEGEVEQVGGMSGIQQVTEGSEPGSGTIKLRGGGKMRRSNFGEQGSIDPELLSFLARYVGAPAAGAAAGYAYDDQHRFGSAVAGAAVGGFLGMMGARAIRMLREGHPDVKLTGSKAKFEATIKNLGDDLRNAAKAVGGNDEMAKKAAAEYGWSTNFDRMARWVQKNVGWDFASTRMAGKAWGIVEDYARMMGDSVKSLSRLPDHLFYRDALDDYFKGNIDHAELLNRVPKNVANLAATATQARDGLQRLIIDGLGGGKLAKAVKDSIGSYLTTTYHIFHDAKYMPTDSQIQAAAESLDKIFPDRSMNYRVAMINEYLHEIKTSRGMFGLSKVKGEKLGGVLTRLDELTPEFRQMLGEYDNPLTRMGFTAQKLVTAARSAEYFNEVARGVKENGLKYAYAPQEWDSAVATLQHEIEHKSLTGSERAILRQKLDELQHYVNVPENSQYGRLASHWVDLRTRDQLATYDSASKLFTTPIGRGFAQATNLIKYGKIILSPLQFTRQVIQLPILGMIAKTLPTDWANAFRILNDESVAGKAEYVRLRKLGVIGGDIVGGMLRKDMDAMLKGNLDAILGQRLSEGLHKWEEIWRTPDLIIRMSAFLRKESELLQKGVDPEVAANRAIDHMNRYTMNYAAVPPIVAKGRQLPFINQYLSWTYETLRITKNLAEDAKKGDVHAMGTLATIGAAPFIIQQLSEQALSPTDRDEWNKVKNMGPAYNRFNFRFVTGRLPNGDFRYVDFTPLVIHDQVMRMIRGAMSGDSEAVNAANPVFGWENTPLLNVASIFVTGRNRYSGDKLYSAADYADAVRKEIAPTLLGTELDRIVLSLTPNSEGGLGVMNLRTGQTNSITDILQTYATSMRPYTLRPSSLMAQAVNEARDQIRAQQITLRRVFASNASDDVKQRARDQFQTTLKHVLSSYQQKVGASQINPESVQP